MIIDILIIFIFEKAFTLYFNFILFLHSMDPQSCSQCNEMPEDILMLACSHDLCLNCAADRLAFEMKRKKNPNVFNAIYSEHCMLALP